MPPLALSAPATNVDRDQTPIAEKLDLGQPAPVMPVPGIFPAEVLHIVATVADVLPLQGFDVLAPLLGVSGRELDQAMQGFLSHLDSLVPRRFPEQIATDWLPWLVIMAGAGAGYEMGRRAFAHRPEESDPFSWPVPGTFSGGDS